MDKPEALRLADALETAEISYTSMVKAAAEMRRLHAENERLIAQRDALLETLKYIATEFRKHGRQHWPEAVRVRAAIKAVEGEKK